MGRPLAERYRTAFVTGAADGIGRCIASMLAKEGVRVWATSRSLDRLAPLVGEAPGLITPLVLDLLRPAEAEACLRGAMTAAGGIDLLVNNAGYGIFGEFAAVPAADWEEQLGAMLGATLRLNQVAWRAWSADRPGCVVNVSSLAVEFPIPYFSGYNAAKAGLSALSESLLFESGPRGVTVIDFRPGDYRTGFNRSMQQRSRTGLSARATAVWRRVDATFNAAPAPERAAADLRRALLRGRSGTVRSGDWFQARFAPLAARFLPGSWRRAISGRYFGLR